MEATLLNYKNIVYISAEYLKESNPSYFLNCNKTIRNIINTKKLTQDQYIYATFNKKTNVWSINNDNPSPKAKLFILKSFSDSNIIVNSNTTTKPEINKQEEQIENAPDILELTDEEKFKDNEGNIVEITVRGTRHHEKCFFRVKDVSDGFDMPSLKDTILDKAKEGYNENIHYKHFAVNNNNKIKKEIYLTYSGLRRFFEVSKSLPIINKNKIILHKWLNNFDNTKLEKYTVNLTEKEKLVNGYIYIIESNLLSSVKIGYWMGNLEGLRSRYVTYYGSNLQIYSKYVYKPFELEKEIHKAFSNNKITNELFTKENIKDYINYIENNYKSPKQFNNSDKDQIIYVDDVDSSNDEEEYINEGKNKLMYYYIFGLCGVNEFINSIEFISDDETKDILKNYNMEDLEKNTDGTIYLCGFTDSVNAMKYFLEKKYKYLLNGKKLEEIAISYIDEQFMSLYKSKIESIYNFINLTNVLNKDILIISDNLKKYIEYEFDFIKKKYSGEYIDIICDMERVKSHVDYKQKEIINLQNEIASLQKENKLIKENHEKEINYLKLLIEKDNELKDFKINYYEKILKNNGINLF